MVGMPVVSLTSDIGQQDYLIGAVKGQLLSCNASLNIVDITHYLSSSNYPQAAYVCKNAFKHFPKQSLHIVLLNLFETKADKMLLSVINDQYLITDTVAKAVNVVFSAGGIAGTGNEINEIVEKYPLRPTIGPNWMEGQILFIDHFENVVINISKEEFEEHRQGRSFKLVFKRNEVIDTIYENYASVQEGEKLAFFNSAGYLEIAINKGNMAGLFGLQGFNERINMQNPAMQNKWFYQTVRVFFE